MDHIRRDAGCTIPGCSGADTRDGWQDPAEHEREGEPPAQGREPVRMAENPGMKIATDLFSEGGETRKYRS